MRGKLATVAVAVGTLIGLTGLAPAAGAAVSTTVADGTVQRTNGDCAGAADVTLEYTRLPSRVDFVYDGPCQLRYASDAGPGVCKDRPNGTLDCLFGTSGSIERTYDITVGPQGAFQASIFEGGELAVELEGDLDRVDV